MKRTFADTFFYLALLNPRDAAHDAAVAANLRRSGRMVTTDWILTELADALAAPLERPRFLGLLEMLESDPDVLIVPADRKLFARGIELYRERPDKDWPLTDCLSFIVMEEQSILEALTADIHFRQAGFVPLLLNE